MAEPPELWTFAASSLLLFVFGAVLTGISYVAYRRNGRHATFRLSTLGFALVTAGGLVEPVYQSVLKGDYHLTGRELLAMQTVEGALIGAGLGLLFYSIYRYNTVETTAELSGGD
jgi:cbb3-type cytochrome oxidase subunit 3